MAKLIYILLLLLISFSLINGRRPVNKQPLDDDDGEIVRPHHHRSRKPIVALVPEETDESDSVLDPYEFETPY